jgi:uncharacterized protein (DUF1697 family)
MPQYVALLAGINLGKRRIRMDALRALFEAMGHRQVQTVLASGNVILDSRIRSVTKLETAIECKLHSALGYAVTTCLRMPAELQAVVDDSPFPVSENTDSACSIQVQFFREALPASKAARVRKIRTPTDAFAVIGRELYWRVTGRLSDSEVWASPEMKALALPAGTMRNMNTVVKLCQRCGGSS